MTTLSQCQPVSKTAKSTWQFASLWVKASFRETILSQLLIFSCSHAIAVVFVWFWFFLLLLGCWFFFLSFSSSTQPFFMTSSSHPSLTIFLVDSPTRNKFSLAVLSPYTSISICQRFAQCFVAPTTFSSYTNVSTPFWTEKAFQVCLISLLSVYVYHPLQKKIGFLFNFPLCL